MASVDVMFVMHMPCVSRVTAIDVVRLLWILCVMHVVCQLCMSSGRRVATGHCLCDMSR